METILQSKPEIVSELRNIAKYFSNKTARNVTFADVDNYDYGIFLIFQKWQEMFPETPFKEEFPLFSIFWEELATWNAQDEWTKNKSECIINKAKNALKEIENYKATLLP